MIKKLKELDAIKLNRLKLVFFSIIVALLGAFIGLVLFSNDLVESVILSTTTFALFALGIFRLVTIIKGDKKQLKVMVNILESIVNITIAVVILLIIPNPDNSTLIVGLYCYLISAVLFGRGIVFLIEGMYCDDKKSVIKFIIHILLIVCATVFIAREMTLTDLTYIMVVLASLGVLFCVFEIFFSFKKYRRALKDKAREELKDEIKEEVKKEMEQDEVKEEVKEE